MPEPPLGAGCLEQVQGVSTAERGFLQIARHRAVLPVVQALLGCRQLDIFGTKVRSEAEQRRRRLFGSRAQRRRPRSAGLKHCLKPAS